MFSLCFIELQQMSNKLEKSYFPPQTPYCFMCAVYSNGGWRGIANTIHIATFTPDMSLGFSSLKVRTNWKKKVHSGI